MRTLRHTTDFCVVGGGLSGLCAAVAAARRGVKVVLIHDRPVLGGNASSEIRMWVCGAHGQGNRETGIIEEILLDNIRWNPNRNWSVWDSILLGKVFAEPNITLLSNASVNSAIMDGNRLATVKAWQGTTETWHEVSATLFADCSGDSILAPLTGAEFRIGRESSLEFNEDIQPLKADKKTMGMSLLIQAREMDSPQPFSPPTWAHDYPTDESLPYRDHDVKRTNWWWIELGGENDSIHDTEELRDELLKVAFGVWDHVKNHGDHGADNWTLEWMGFLPGKRESRRYVGDHIMTQGDVRSEGRFHDIIAYGGWSMDDHHPAGFRHPGYPTIFHPAPSPFGIPYRSLYSKNIENLLCAGRNISVSHAALSATRVMATCSTIGQAVGTAASIAISHGLTPRGVYQERLDLLQQSLMDDDSYLPFMTRGVPKICRHDKASISASIGSTNPEVLRNGLDRLSGTDDGCWIGGQDSWVMYDFNIPTSISQVRLVFDSQLDRREPNMPCNVPRNAKHLPTPPTIIKSFRLEGRANGEWQTLTEVQDNHQRLVKLKISGLIDAIRLTPLTTWGASDYRIISWDVE